MKRNLLYALCLILCLALSGCGNYKNTYSIDKEVEFIEEITGSELDKMIEDLSKEDLIGSFRLTGEIVFKKSTTIKTSYDGEFIFAKEEDGKIVFSEINTIKVSSFNEDKTNRYYVKDNYLYSINSKGEQEKKYIDKPYMTLDVSTLATVFNLKKLISDVNKQYEKITIKCGYDSFLNLILEIDVPSENSEINKYRFLYKDNNLGYFCYKIASSDESICTYVEMTIDYKDVELKYPEVFVFEEEKETE